jgi:hypothetical protein
MIPAAIDRPAGIAAGGYQTQSPAAANAVAVRGIRDLNDELRRTLAGGRIVVTAGVQELSDTNLATLLRQVRTYDDFAAGNDPYGEHDFGHITIAGAGYCFKIDYYDASFEYGAADPSDEALTRRVMTIMREDEY